MEIEASNEASPHVEIDASNEASPHDYALVSATE